MSVPHFWQTLLTGVISGVARSLRSLTAQNSTRGYAEQHVKIDDERFAFVSPLLVMDDSATAPAIPTLGRSVCPWKTLCVCGRSLVASVGVSAPPEEGAWLEATDGKRHSIKGSCSLGRTGANTIVLESPKVSRRHALIHLQNVGELWLIDFGSSNGTFLNNGGFITRSD
jgi:FHA domain